MPDRFEGESLVSQLAGETDVLELIELFISELPRRITAMQETLDESDLARLSVLAHQLKGSAGSYGFPTIGVAAADVEKASRAQSDLDTIKAEIEALAELCRRARATPDLPS